MKSIIDTMGLIDIISERHHQLRRCSESMWSHNSNLYISNSEWLILANVYHKEHTTISYVTKNVDLTRQATHKFIKRLEEQGLVKVEQVPHNKKEKAIELSELGIECFEKNEKFKAKIEEDISSQIGEEELSQLKELLRTDWRI
ncbi:MarR family winged helix-turn-helix transcriptional regulator [Alkalibacillus silvisoli]|uniref:HTH marR-type domain-containing protein n=1 Tax=Alkalibacillus silvisoli TaxID=392823 RepID=A0ABN1AB83_9BACI